MSLRSWLRKSKSVSRRSNSRRYGRHHGRRRLHIESLENRALLSATILDVEPNDTIADAEANVIANTAPLLQSGDQAQGTIGNTAAEAQDVDMYKIHLNQGDLASFGGADAHGWQNVRLRLFDSSGVDLGGANLQGGGLSYWNTFYAKQTGDYYVGLSGAGNATYDPNVGGSGQGGFWTGNYTLTYSVTQPAVDEVEPNDGIGTANPVAVSIGTPATVKGYLGNGPAQTDKDLYTFSMSVGTTLSVTPGPHPQGGNFTNQASLRLLDGSGAVLATDQYVLNYTSFLNQQVYLEYTNFPYLMYAYQLTFVLSNFSGVQDLPEPNDTTATALTLSGGQAQGYIGNSPAGAQDVDMYSISLSQGDEISFAGADAHGWQNVRLRLFDATGTDLGGGNLQGGGVSYWNTFYAKQAGTYYVGLSSAGNAAYDAVTGAGAQGGVWTGGYTLTYSITNLALDEVEPNDGIPTAQVVGVAIGTPLTVKGYLGNGPALVDKDVYAFFMPAGTTLTVTPSQHPQSNFYTSQASLRLLDYNGSVLAANQYALSYTSFITRPVYLEYSNLPYLLYGYQLTFALNNFSGVQDLPEPNNTIATAMPLSGGQAQGYIGNSAAEAQDVDMYSISLSQGDEISFAGADAHGWQNVRLRLFDASGTDLGGANLQGGGLSYWNTFYAKQAGTYYVGLSSAGNAAYDPITGAGSQGGAWTGGYTLTYSIAHPTLDETEPNDSLDTADVVGVSVGSPVTVKGYLGDGPALADKDYYTLFMAAGTTLTVVPSPHPLGGNFTNQASLRLLDGAGSVLAADQYSLNFTSFFGRQVYVEYTNFPYLMYAHQLTFTLSAAGVDPNAPTVTPIPDQVTNEDTVLASIPFTVGDLTTPTASLTVTASSSDPNLVPNANIVLGGIGANRTVTVTPAANQSGVVKITVAVQDGDGNVTSDLFVLHVNPVNDPPMATVVLNTAAPQTNDVLTATATAFDLDGDPVTLTYVWKVNGVPVQSTTTTSLADTFNLALPGHGDKGQTVSVEVTPNDGTANGAMVSASAVVVGSAPTATVVLNSTAPHTNDVLTATSTASDPDSDPVTLTYVWKVNGVPVQTTTTTSLTDTFNLALAGHGNKGQTVTVEVTPNDGTVNGAMVSASAVVADTAPTATVTLNSTTPSRHQMLVASASAVDADGDPIVFVYTWKINGVIKQVTTTSAAVNTFSLHAFQAQIGDVVTLEVTPYDGTLYGPIASVTAIVTH
jgi:hypothetical protein